MDLQIGLSLGALVPPWLSGRTVWFVLLSGLGVAIQLLSADHCIDTTEGMAGIVCVFFALIALLLLAAGIVEGIARLITSGGGQRPADWRRVLLVAAISHAVAVLTIVIVIMRA